MSEIMPDPTPNAYPAAPEPESEETPWSLSQDDWTAYQQRVDAVLDYVSNQPQIVMPNAQPPGQQQRMQWDPFDNETVDRYIDERLNSRMAHLEQHVNQQREEGVEEWMREGLSELGKQGGEFDIEMARLRVDPLVNQLMPKYQDLWKATEAAMEQAAKEQRAYEQQMVERAITQHTNQLATLAGAPHEPGATYSVGTQERVVPDYRANPGMTVASRFFGRNAES